MPEAPSLLWRPGLTPDAEQRRGVNVFRCPRCGKQERGAVGELACTGPGALDTHSMTPMLLVP